MYNELPLQAIADSISSNPLPPVHAWQPESVRTVDLHIRSNGDWIYQGSRIERVKMVRLFSSVLRVDGGQTYLVTPHEKLLISVEDAPFTVVDINVTGLPDHPIFEFKTNVGDSVIANQMHPIYLQACPTKNELRPYIRVRDELVALISRAVYYELANYAVEQDGYIGVVSAGCFMVLDQANHSE